MKITDLPEITGDLTGDDVLPIDDADGVVAATHKVKVSTLVTRQRALDGDADVTVSVATGSPTNTSTDATAAATFVAASGDAVVLEGSLAIVEATPPAAVAQTGNLYAVNYGNETVLRYQDSTGVEHRVTGGRRTVTVLGDDTHTIDADDLASETLIVCATESGTPGSPTITVPDDLPPHLIWASVGIVQLGAHAVIVDAGGIMTVDAIAGFELETEGPNALAVITVLSQTSAILTGQLAVSP